MKTLRTLILREFWEHRQSFIRIPLLISLIMTVTMVCASIYFLAHSWQWHESVALGGTWHGHKLHEALAFAFYAVATPFVVIMWIIMINYFLGCLYEDRKDRSILFWHSMPIGQVEMILSKLISGVIILPLCVTIAALATEVVLLVVLSLTMMLKGLTMWHLLWQPGALLLSWYTQLVAVMQQIVWLFPFIGWFMLCSAFSKKSPSLRALLPLVLVMIIEGFFIHPTLFTDFVAGHLCAAYHAWIHGFAQIDHRTHAWWSQVPDAFTTASFTSGLLGLGIGVVFIMLSGVIRHRNFDQ